MRVKKLILSLSAMMSLMISSISQANAVTWRTDFKQATEDAKQQHKLVLLKFSGSDWCLPCIRMEKEIFSQDTFSNFAAEHLIMVNADFPHKKTGKLTKETEKQNEALAEKYDKEGHFPYTVLLDSDGKVLMTWNGYSSATKAADIIQEIKRSIIDK